MSKTETCCGSHFPGRALVAAEQIDTYTHAKPGTSLHGGGRGQASLLWLQDARSCPLFQLRLESNLELGHKSLQPRSSHLPWITPKKSSNCLSSLHRRNDRPPPIYFRPRHQKNHDGIATCHGQPWKLAESCAIREVSNSHSSTEASFRFKHCFCSQPKGHLKLLCQLLCTAAKSKCCLPCSDRNAGRGLQLLSTHRLKEGCFRPCFSSFRKQRHPPFAAFCGPYRRERRFLDLSRSSSQISTLGCSKVDSGFGTATYSIFGFEAVRGRIGTPLRHQHAGTRSFANTTLYMPTSHENSAQACGCCL